MSRRNLRLTEGERRLCNVLAQWLLEEMVRRLSDPMLAPDGFIHDNAQTNFEIGCSALSVLGFLKAEGGIWKILCSPKAFPGIRPEETRLG